MSCNLESTQVIIMQKIIINNTKTMCSGIHVQHYLCKLLNVSDNQNSPKISVNIGISGTHYSHFG